ncbi:MAG: hypothetical protein WC469_03405 [Candidatus Omnitrophota bacterium]
MKILRTLPEPALENSAKGLRACRQAGDYSKHRYVWPAIAFTERTPPKQAAKKIPAGIDNKSAKSRLRLQKYS